MRIFLRGGERQDVGDHFRWAACPSGVNTVGEENDEHVAVRIDPERRAGEACVAVGTLAEVLAAASVPGACVPAKCPRACRARREQAHCRIRDQPRAAVLSTVEHHLREDGEIGGSAKQSRVPSDSAEGERILVVDLAAERISARRVDLGGSDPLA